MAMGACFGQTPSSEAAGAPDMATEVSKMREAIAAQEKVVLEQQKQLLQQQQELEKLKQQVASWQNTGTAGHAAQPRMINAAVHTPMETPAAGPQQESPQARESPLSFRIGSTEFTPGGFVDFENVFRTTNSGSIITTNFGAIPFSNTPQGHLTENRTTAQFTRLDLKVTGRYGATDVLGYAEMDFNGNDVGNVFATANSHTFRERLAFLDVRRNRWEMVGGQTWSWLTPNRRGLGPMPTDLALTYNEDGNAQVGIPYTRAAEFRLIYHPGSRWAAGVGIENAEQYSGFGAGEVVFPSAFNAQLASQFDPNNTTNSTPNVMPDILSKISYDTDFGNKKHFHAETVGLLTAVKTAVALPGAPTFQTHSTRGGAVGAAFNIEIVKNLRLLANGLYTDGAGRYLIGLGPSAIVRADGTPSLVHSGDVLAGIEYQPTPKTQFGVYYGAVYFQRNFMLDTSPGAKLNTFVGFGGPNSANNNNKSIQEPTFDWTQTFWRHPQYGALVLVTQTSYLTRSPWLVVAGAPKNAHLVMAYTSLRYVLP